MRAETLQQAARDVTRAQETLRELVVQAVTVDGHTKSWVCDMSGVTRPTINRWINERQDDPSR